MSVHFNEGNGLEDLKECVVNINGEIKNVSSIYENMENTNLKASRIWGTNKGYNFNSILMGSSGNRKYFSGDNFNDLQDIIINWNGNENPYALSSFIVKIGNFILTNAGADILKSYDGISFDKIFHVVDDHDVSIAHGINTIVIKCTTRTTSGSTYIYCSKDEGVTWTSILLTSEIMRGDVIYGNGKFICYSTVNGNYYYSDNGIDWLPGNIFYLNGYVHIDFTIWGIMFMNGKFIGHGRVSGDGSGNNRRCFSDDGINWTMSDINGGFGNYSRVQYIGYVNGKYYVYAQYKSFYYSTDSITWEFGEMNIDSLFAVITYSKKQNKFFLISNTHEVFYSYDMTNWEYIITLPQYFDHESKIYMD